MFIFKVDFEKAFDSVNWHYVDFVMEQMGFSKKWRSWMHGCLDSSRASVLINGSPTLKFSISKGVRQSDPLSPFLFRIAMEGLKVALKSACEKALYCGIKIPKEGPTISHIFYADDTIFFGEWDNMNLKNLARILTCFQVSSGLKVNFSKSRVFGICTSSLEVKRRAHTLGCLDGVLSSTYLGANMGLKRNWLPIIEKFQLKLSN